VLITGASSGIGEATARHLALAGHHVFLGARRTDRLIALTGELRAAGASAEHHELDVTDRTSVTTFVEAATALHGRVDVLVNNAGVMPLSLIEELRIDDWDHMIDVNLRGTLHGIAAVLPIMRRQGAGHIVNVSSVSGHRVDATAAVYSATKFAVRALSEGLRQENDTVRVTLVSPGFTRTELADHGGEPSVRQQVRRATDQIGLPAEVVARTIAYAIDQPADVDVNEIVVRPTAQR
jgi:NADP-dependent 3-hydroxy acid dehydrogenase YdfG